MQPLLFLALLSPANEGVHGLTPAQFDAWTAGLAAKGVLPASVSVHVFGGKALFAAATAPNPLKLAFVARQGLTPAEFNALTGRLLKDGYRLDSLSVYLPPTGGRLAAVWVKDKEVAHSAKFGLDNDAYQKFFNEQARAGFRPVSVNGYLEGKTVKYAAVFQQTGGDWTARHGLREADYQSTVTTLLKDGYRLAFVSAHWDGSGPAFNLVAERDGRECVARHGLTAAAYQSELNAQAKAGLDLGGVTGYPTKAGTRYAAFWLRPKKAAPAELPVTGDEVPELAAFDKAMLKYMREREFEAGALCVSKGGRILLSRGYGFLTRDHKKKLPPDAPFRIASITKPITAAIIHDLARQGKFALDDRAFAYIGTELPPGKTADARLKDITIRHLLDHKGGFDRDAKPLSDPMFQPSLVRKELKLSAAPTPRDVVRFMNGRKLDFDPGKKTAYSNYGYCVLGRVIEKATGTTYTGHLRKFLAPHGIKGITLGRTLPEARDPREPFYYDPGFATNCITGSGTVPWPDGGFNLEAMDAHGGLISSAPDLARFLHAYWIGGQQRKGDGQSWLFFGSLPGTWSMAKQRRDGLNIVALFNQRSCPPGLKPDDIQGVLDKAADSVKKWP